MTPSDWTPTAPPRDRAPATSIAILGTDAVLAALPATSGQLAQACVDAGYAAAVPASWGDELVAAACLRRLAPRDAGPAVLCACPLVAARLPELGDEVARLCVPLVAPPVAAARYVRALYGTSPVRIAYIGACPAAADPSIDAHETPAALLAALADRGIDPAREDGDGRVPSGYRRFRSLPGGAPSPEALWEQGGRRLVEVVGDDYARELTERVRARERALLDLAPRLGCVCSGAIPACPPHTARAAVAAVEPPRARGDVLDPSIVVELDRTLPRTGVPPAARATPDVTPVAADRAGAARRPTPLYTPRRRLRTSGHVSAIPARGGAQPPASRTAEGRTLPRAYLGARHRVATGSIFAVTPESSPATRGEREVQRAVQSHADAMPAPHTTTGAVVVPIPSGALYRVPPPDATSAGRGILIAVVVMLVILIVAALLIL